MTAETFLPSGFCVRPPCEADLQAIVDMTMATDLLLVGESDACADDLRADWSWPSFDLQKDAWVIETIPEPGQAHSRVVGYEEVWNRAGHYRLDGDGVVHPDYRGLGIGTALLRTMEARAREHIPMAPAGVRVALRNGLYGSDLAGHRLHESEGYRPVRYYWRMELQMDTMPPEPEIPAGLLMRCFQPGEDPHPVFDTLEDAFRDHWGYVPWEFPTWQVRMMDESFFDPSLWWMVFDGEQLAAACACRFKHDMGWVSQLGVRRPWRCQGLGQALLYAAFGEFYRRGAHKVALGVDAANLTGATRLYERVGMQVAQRFVVYEKELRPGVEILGEE